MARNPKLRRPDTTGSPLETSDELLILALVASRARNRAPVPWLLSKFQLSQPKPGPVPPEVVDLLNTVFGHLDESLFQALPKRDAKLAAFVAIQRLEDAGAIAVERAAGEPRYLSLVRHAERKYLFRKATAAVIAEARTKTRAVARIAEITGKDERTVWRWIRGEYAPDLITLVTLTMATGLFAATPIALTAIGGVHYLVLTMRLGACQLSPGERNRAERWARDIWERHGKLGSDLWDSAFAITELMEKGKGGAQ